VLGADGAKIEQRRGQFAIAELVAKILDLFGRVAAKWPLGLEFRTFQALNAEFRHDRFLFGERGVDELFFARELGRRSNFLQIDDGELGLK